MPSPLTGMIEGRDVPPILRLGAFRPARRELPPSRTSCSPLDWTLKNVEPAKDSRSALASSYDGTREVRTFDPSSYKWRPSGSSSGLRFFLQERLGFAPRATVTVRRNDGILLANEQVHDVQCWACHRQRSHQKPIRDTLVLQVLRDGRSGLPETTSTIVSSVAESRRPAAHWIGKSVGCNRLSTTSTGRS